MTNFLEDVFENVIPIMQKAAPVLCSALVHGKLSPVICGLLGAIVDTNPLNPENIAKNLMSDPDLYAKLSKLEETHKDWIKGRL
jgi:hypothetical protein